MSVQLRLAAMTSLIALASTTLAQSGGNYVMQKRVIGAGGATASGGAYELTGTVGQHAAVISCANAYRVRSGFWAGLGSTDVIFRNGFEAGC